MATQSPFPFLDDLFSRLSSGLQPPAWMVEETQRRFVLLVNHVLMQEPEAQARLARQAGRVLQAQWRNFVVRVVATRAGLLDLAPPAIAPDLTLTVTEQSPWGLAQAAFRGDKPPVGIAGDVRFAAEVNWLVDNVRWDLEEDLSRLLGDAPAHALGQAVRSMVDALRQFAGRRTAGAEPASAGQPVPPGPGQAGA
jgi:ubiquinone biosynthesis accessory factor UbiJ